MTKHKPSLQEEIFKGSVLIKGFNGIVEILGALFILLFGSQAVVALIEKIFSHEIFQDPNDFIINFLIDLFVGTGKGTPIFIAVYLGIHGLLNVFLFTAVWKKKISLYPIVIVIMMLFIAYQIFRFYSTQSLVLLTLTIIDMIIIYFVAREYVQKRDKTCV